MTYNVSSGTLSLYSTTLVLYCSVVVNHMICLWTLFVIDN